MPKAALAQSVYVTNLGQDDDSGPNSNTFVANSFQTGGASADRYSLTSMEIDFSNGADTQGVTVSVYNNSGGTPGTQVDGSLNKVGSAGSGNITYSVSSGGITLNGGTTYWVVIKTVLESANLDGTISDDEDADSTTGWSIGNVAYSGNLTSWTAGANGQAMRFRVDATRQARNHEPVFTTQRTFAVAENEKWVGFAVAKDANPQDEVIYNIGGGEDGHLFFINYSGAFGFQERFLPDYENPGDADRDNVYEVVIRAISGRGERRRTATQAITVRVFDVDETTDPGGPAPPTPDNTGGGGGGTGGGTAPGPPQSSDAALSGLGISDLSIDFDPGKETYTAYAPRGTGRVTVTPTARHRGAEITVNGQRTQSGESVSVDLEGEETRIEITVTAEDGTVRTYTVTIIMSCPEERRVLESFYEETGGESWHSNENWNSPEPLGQWYGVSLGEDAPGGVRVETPDGCPEETEDSGGGGCALGSVDSSASGLFLLALLAFAVLVVRNRRFLGNP